MAEQNLQLFLEKRGVAAPSQDLPDVQRETELKMACIAAVEPEWDEYEGLQALEAGFKITNPDLYEGLCISPEMMAEVLAASEAKWGLRLRCGAQPEEGQEGAHGSDTRRACEISFSEAAPLEVGSER